MFLKGLSGMPCPKSPQYEDIEEEDIEKLLQKDAPWRDVKAELFAIKINTAVNHF